MPRPKETAELLIFALKFGEHLKDATADRKVSLKEAFTLGADLLGAGEALSGIGTIPEELSHITGSGTAELVGIVGQAFPFASNEDLARKVESAQRFIPHLVVFIQELRGVPADDIMAEAPAERVD